MKRQTKNSSFGKTAILSYEGREGLVYARVSSKKQETEGSGLQSQEGRCRDDLRSIHVPYIKTFPDSYSGGGDFMKRPAMRELLAYIDARPHKKFVVDFDDLKRFARDVEFHLKLRAAFKARDVVLRCLNYNFDESPEGRFAEIVMAGSAQLEREQNRRQVIQKMKARLEAGYWPFGGKKGYVMTKDPMHGKIAVPHEIEAPILKEALEGFSTGKFIRRIDVCKYLVEKGFWKKQKPEKYIDKFTNILKDPFHAGYIQYPDWDVERRLGHHQQIIELEIFEKNQRRLRGEELNKRVRVDVSADFPLRGLINCDHCKDHLTGAWSKGRKKRYAYYICHNKNCQFYGKSINKKDIEEKFDEAIKKQCLKPKVEILVKKVFDKVWKEAVSDLQNKEAMLLQNKLNLEDKATQLTEIIIATKSIGLKKVYEGQLERIAHEIEQTEEGSIRELDLSVPYRTALDKAIGLLRNPYFVWERLEIAEQQKLFYFIFEQKLPYNQVEGYRTDKITTKMRLFEEFSNENPHDVDPPGIEPGPRPCHGRVRPIYYGPE